MPCYWKLFESDQLEKRVLGGFWIAFTLAGRRILLCCWVLSSFGISIFMYIANFIAFRGYTVCLRSSFWISISIRMVMKPSLIRVFSFSQNYNFWPIPLVFQRNAQRFRPPVAFWWDEEDVSVKSDIFRFDERVFYNFAEFGRFWSVDHDVRIFAVKNCASLYANAQVEKEDLFFDPQVAKVNLCTLSQIQKIFRIFLLPIHLLLCISDIVFPLWLRLNSSKLLVYWFQWKLYNFDFRAEKCIE